MSTDVFEASAPVHLWLRKETSGRSSRLNQTYSRSQYLVPTRTSSGDRLEEIRAPHPDFPVSLVREKPSPLSHDRMREEQQQTGDHPRRPSASEPSDAHAKNQE